NGIQTAGARVFMTTDSDVLAAPLDRGAVVALHVKPTFFRISPDGEHLVDAARLVRASDGTFVQLLVPGVDQVYSVPWFSPDGRHIAFTHGPPKTAMPVLTLVVTANGSRA